MSAGRWRVYRDQRPNYWHPSSWHPLWTAALSEPLRDSGWYRVWNRRRFRSWREAYTYADKQARQ